MHVGLGLCFQSLDGANDKDVYKFELALAAGAENAGFDSIWTPEHHFSDYQMTPNVPQFLAWVAEQPNSSRSSGFPKGCSCRSETSVCSA